MNYYAHNASHFVQTMTHGARAVQGEKSVLRTRHIYVVVCGGKMAALGDTTALGVNGLIRQFTAITGKIFFCCGI